MTAEHQARLLLDRLGVPNALNLSSGDVVELANVIAVADATRWALDNIYTMARRELNRLQQPYAVPDTLAIERWRHVLQLCEKVGCQGRGVLKDNGGSMPKETR